jgi:hypothetical protein
VNDSEGSFVLGSESYPIQANTAFVFGTNNTERARITSDGNVGIGTTSPSDTSSYGRALDIQSSTGAAIYLRDSDGPTTSYGVVAYDASIDSLTLGSITASTGIMRLLTAGSERARIDSSGNFRVANGQLQASAGSGDSYMARLSCAYNFPTVDTYLDSVAGTSYSGQIMFRTSSSGGAMVERARVTSVGDFLVGTTSYSTGGIEKTIVVSGNSSAGFQLARSAAVAAYIYTYASVGFRVETTSSYANVEFSPGGSGGVQLTSGATSWTSLSDERTKTDLVPITDAIQKVASLRAVTGRFIKDDPEKSRSFLIAQDFVDVFPQAVTPYNEKDNETEYLGLAYTDTIPLLVAAIKEQQALIETLTQRITALEGR